MILFEEIFFLKDIGLQYSQVWCEDLDECVAVETQLRSHNVPIVPLASRGGREAGLVCTKGNTCVNTNGSFNCTPICAGRKGLMREHKTGPRFALPFALSGA